MTLTTLVLTFVLASPTDDGALKCIVMGEPVPAKARAVEFAGLYLPFCCPGCDRTFAKEPGKFMKRALEGSSTVAMSLFDPVSGERITEKAAKAKVDYKGVRYVFQSEANRKAFDANPAKFAKAPEKESLTCPVMGEKIDAYSHAVAYFDVEGTRYYICCPGCLGTMKADPKGTVAKSKPPVGAPKAIPAPKG